MEIFAVLTSLFSLVALSVQESHTGRCELDGAPSAATKLVCRQMTSEFSLYQEITSIKRLNNIKELVVESSEFRFFMKESFIGTSFASIYLKNCTILDLTDGDTAFEGLEDRLELLKVEGASFVDNWNWNHLRNLRKLKQLFVMSSEFDAVPDSFQNISKTSLERIDLRRNGISWIHEKAFSKFSEMTNLILSNNELQSLSRSMLPRPSKLQGINLSFNKLETLPSDIFSDMPDLTKIAIHHNPLHTLDEKIFGPLWSQLDLLHITDSSLRCDCRMKWITRAQRKRSVMFFVMCQSPADLKGRLVLTLKPEELWC